MKNLLTLLLIAAFAGLAMLKGVSLLQSSPHPAAVPRSAAVIPSIGRIQVLNGCGSGGSARIMAEYLRRNHFDVKNIGNAENWNFSNTMVIARVSDTTIAAQVAAVLSTKNMVLIRTAENLYDVTVIVGSDYRELMQ